MFVAQPARCIVQRPGAIEEDQGAEVLDTGQPAQGGSLLLVGPGGQVTVLDRAPRMVGIANVEGHNVPAKQDVKVIKDRRLSGGEESQLGAERGGSFDVLDHGLGVVLQEVVRLVNYQGLQVAELQMVVIQHVENPAGRPHDDIGVLMQLHHLATEVSAPGQRLNLHANQGGPFPHYPCRLQGQLLGWRQDQQLGTGPRHHLGKQRQRKGQGLTGTGRGDPENGLIVFEGLSHRGLNRRWFLVAFIKVFLKLFDQLNIILFLIIVSWENKVSRLPH